MPSLWTKAIQETRCALAFGWCAPGLKSVMEIRTAEVINIAAETHTNKLHCLQLGYTIIIFKTLISTYSRAQTPN